MKTYSAKEIHPYLGHILLYGASGTGKTYFSARSGNSTCIIDLDNGALSARGTDVDIIPRNQANDWKHTVEAIEWAFNSGNYDVVSIDSFTMLSDFALQYVLRANGQMKPRIQDYGEQITMLQSLVDRLTLVEPPPIVLCVCHEDTTINDDGAVIGYRPLVIGRKFPGTLPRFFSEYWRAVRKLRGMGKAARTEYTLLCQSGRNYEAKSRLGLPAEIPMKWDAVFSALKGGE